MNPVLEASLHTDVLFINKYASIVIIRYFNNFIISSPSVAGK